MTRLTFICLLVLMSSCNHSPDLECTKPFLFENNSASKFVTYKQHIEIDRRFTNELIYDTLNVNVFMSSNADLSFNVSNDDSEWFFNNGTMIMLNHKEQTKSIEKIDNMEELNASILWSNNLLSVLDSIQSHKCELQTKNNKKVRFVEYQHEAKSHVDTNKVVVNKFQYTFPQKTLEGIEFKEIITRDLDTLQIQKHEFQNIENKPKESLAKLINRFNKNQYAMEVKEESLPFGAPPIKEGEQLSKVIYNDIDSMKVSLVNEDYSLVMFSFIGCTACEIALADLKKDHQLLIDRINIYYSSFQNNNSSLKKYLEGKPFFKNSFGRESKMIADFRLADAPTFVIINSKGIIEKIIAGYDETVFQDIEDIIGMDN